MIFLGHLYPEEAMMLKPFSISPSYQSELSDCSFYPPTHSSSSRQNHVSYTPQYNYYPPVTEDDEAMVMSSSLDLLLSSDLGAKYNYSPNQQLCPCAMELSGACPNCARSQYASSN